MAVTFNAMDYPRAWGSRILVSFTRSTVSFKRLTDQDIWVPDETVREKGARSKISWAHSIKAGVSHFWWFWPGAKCYAAPAGTIWTSNHGQLPTDQAHLTLNIAALGCPFSKAPLNSFSSGLVNETIKFLETIQILYTVSAREETTRCHCQKEISNLLHNDIWELYNIGGF